MTLAVLLTNYAARDLEELHDYIALHDGPGKAEHILAQIEKAFSRSLRANPRRSRQAIEIPAFSVAAAVRPLH